MEQQKEFFTHDRKVHEIINLLLEVSNFNTEEVNIIDLNPTHFFRISWAIAQEKKIQFALPAFPAKSANPLKTSSALPDLGELEALKRLNSLVDKISKIHEPGAEIIICSDGRVFSDLVGVTEDDVTNYGKKLRDLACKYKLKHISFFDLEDVFTRSISFHSMRDKLERDFAQPLEVVKKRSKESLQGKSLFNGIHRFIKEDYLVLNKDLSKNKVTKLSKEVAYKVIQRSNAWGALVEKKIPQAIRLSIHPQAVDSEKFPVKLLPGGGSWGTPWHRVPLVKDGELSLIRHEEALEIGAIKKVFENEFTYFEKVGS